MFDRRDFMKSACLATMTVAGSSLGGEAVKGAAAAAGSGSGLEFSDSGQFKIVQFTDTHIKNRTEQDDRTVKLMGDILDLEKPDLVVMTGDNLAGAEDFRKSLDFLVSPMVTRQIKWALVLGNHDDEPHHDRKELMQYVCSRPYSLAQMGPEQVHGYGNYYLTISSKSSDQQWGLYMIDSNAYTGVKGRGTYDWIRSNQVAWYGDTSQKLSEKAARENSKLNALAFFHIPFNEYDTALNKGDLFGGRKFEEVSSPAFNSGLFTAMIERNDVRGVFVGHDHVNDYEVDFHGIRLCYGRATGYNTYGADKLCKGAKMIVLDEKSDEFKTWMRADQDLKAII